MPSYTKLLRGVKMTEQEYADLQTLEALRGCRALLKSVVGDVTKIECLISIRIGQYEKKIVIEEAITGAELR